jgi:2-polyprenyl-3-methyl-5-hydroxy-6-metoxy-1,4-benzoquinol methylase
MENKEMENKLWNDLKNHLEEIKPCIICNSIDLEKWANINYLVAKKCKECGMISVNPHFNDEGLKLLYSNYFYKRQENDILNAQRKLVYQLDHDWINNFIYRGRVLDVGCSGGFFLDHFSKKNWIREGVEIAGNSADYARDKFEVLVHEGLITEINFEKKYDLVMFRGVIEHFRDPISVFKKCNEIIKPGGYLYFTATPAGDSFAFEVYREKWALFTPLEHIHFFTVELLNLALSKYNFEYVSHHYQYQETPYANPQSDYNKILKDICLKQNNKFHNIDSSVPFPGSMITALWKKV